MFTVTALSYRTVARWVAEFQDPTQAFEDVPRGSRLPTALTDESIRAVEEVVMRDRQRTGEGGISPQIGPFLIFS